MTGLIAILERETPDMSHLPRYPAQRTLMAIEKKAEYLAGLENEDDTSKRLAIYRKQQSIKNEFEKFTSHNENNKRWKGCAEHLEAHINKNAPNIMLKGLDEL